jgi:sec-independent protein translocase protein TatB
MFDVSFTELLVIGVVALVVIGPERLPKVARTLGHLVGRAQRYVNDVKTDIQREVELDELRNLKNQMQDAAQSVQSSLQSTEDSLRKPLDSLEQDVSALRASMTNPEIPEPVTPEISAPVLVPMPIPTQLEIDALAPVSAQPPVSVATTTPESKS